MFKAATKIYCEFERSWGIILMLKSLQKQLQRRYKQRCLKIDTLLRILMFFMPILTLIAPTGDNARASFLVHQVLCTSTTVWWYRQMFTHFSLRVRASEYTCCLMIAKLLYHWSSLEGQDPLMCTLGGRDDCPPPPPPLLHRP